MYYPLFIMRFCEYKYDRHVPPKTTFSGMMDSDVSAQRIPSPLVLS